jgi:ribose/xylose/arabinose/galactoside ABC-type transport system permease subunit
MAAGGGDRVSYDDGFRDSPAFRDSVAYRESAGKHAEAEQQSFLPGSYPVGGYPNEYGTETTLGLREQEYETLPPAPTQNPPAAETHRQGPVRDRVGVHLLWELALLLAVAGVGFLLWRADRNVLRGQGLEALYIQVAIVGAVAVAMALSLRAAVPNLALGPIVFAAAMFFAENSGRGVLVTAGVTVLLAAAAGVVIAIVVTAFHVPSWAASLGAGLGLIVWIQDHRTAEAVVSGAYDPRDHAVFFFGGFVALSVLGGVLGLVGGLRRATGRYRPTGDPSTRGGGGAVPAALALIASSVFAAAAGVLLALNNREVAPTENGVGLTVLALGAALVGGTSIYGRRGGLFGTVLAVSGLVLLSQYLAAEKRGISVFALAAGAIGVGLLVSRLVETLGRPREEPEPVASATPAEVEYDPPPLDIPHDVTYAGQRPWEQEDDPRPAERWDERWASH